MKLINYKEISNNVDVVIFELELERVELSWFKYKTVIDIRKAQCRKYGKVILSPYWLDSGECFDHRLSSSVEAIIKSGEKEFKV